MSKLRKKVKKRMLMQARCLANFCCHNSINNQHLFPRYCPDVVTFITWI